MRHVKWIVIVLLISSLVSFVGKDSPTRGLNVGDMAPDFSIRSLSDDSSDKKLSDLRGHYVLLSFWASYDAKSRMQNAGLNQALDRIGGDSLKMVSISFDTYPSVFKETVRNDQIAATACFVEVEGEDSGLYKKYRLNRGFSNYLLDKDGVIVARNVSSAELYDYFN